MLASARPGPCPLRYTPAQWTGGEGAPGTYAMPLEFPAPADHSGDGGHAVEYRSIGATGLVEPVQRLRVDVDTVRPEIRLRPSVLGRDGVLRLRLRIDDASCGSVTDFGFWLHGRVIGRFADGSYSGFSIPTNRWVTFRDSSLSEGVPTGRYRLTFWANDRAGNHQVRMRRTLLIVRRHKPRWSGSGGAGVPTGAERRGGFVTRRAAPALPDWTPSEVREALAQLALRPH